jgi:LPXTG-motif cell wall-anchored protein
VEAGQSLPATGSALILPATIIGSAMLLTGPALLLVARRRGN